jgi:hypothetical protein
VPGWGQYYNDEPTKGLWVGGITLGAFAGVVGTYVAASDAQREYENLGAGLPQEKFDASYGNWESLAGWNYAFFTIFSVSYLYNIYDAATGKKAGKSVTATPRLELLLADYGPVAKYDLLNF